VKFLFPNGLTSWIFQRLTIVVGEMNERFFGFDLTSFDQGLQLTRYDGQMNSTTTGTSIEAWALGNASSQ
jgi:hypothetical protein